VANFSAPIPGQSLTQEPGNQPWEQPPLYSDNNQAIAFHMKNLTKDDRMEDMLFYLEQGVPLQGMVDSIMTMAVMNGVHTLDTSTLISPVMHQFVKEAADGAGVKYKEWVGPTEEQKRKEKDKKRLQVMLSNAPLTQEEQVPSSPSMPSPEEEAALPKTGFIKRKSV
jgi:hypothetical protein